VTGIIIVIF